MKPRSALLPCLLITLGGCWLLNNVHMQPHLSWIWILLPVVAGVMVLVLERINKSTIVLGPMLILSGVASLCYQLGWMEWDIVAPALLIILGILLLVARHPAIPA